MLAGEAIQKALKDAGITAANALYIGNAYSSTYSSQSQLGALIAEYIGMTGVEAYTIEAGDASGGAALRAGYLAVASGAIDTALVVGVEKSTDTLGSARVSARTVSLDADYEAAHGVTLTALAALLMRRYMHEYQLDPSVFEGFSINAHSNGTRNEYAMYHNTLKPGAFLSAPLVADPINLLDSAPDADGAAAVVLSRADRAADMVPQPIYIAGSSAATDTLTLHDRTDLLFLKAAHLSAQRAYQQARITSNNIDLFELHDAFTILSTLTLEACGFAERGEGWKLAQDRGAAIALDGKIPISTFGGLKSRGNPAGASGIYQAVEACLQLRNEAGSNQVQHAKIALIQSLGGIASTAVTHILKTG
jgi:acetyl-CoA C-acetyltransferase